MTSELCRVTVHGPDGRADLAVPVSVPVATLLPVLLHRTGKRGSGTPESLDWRDGEELFLRPATDPLPELDFDDVADGMASTVRRLPGRWLPDYHRWLFLGCCVAALAVLALVLLAAPARPATVVAAIVAAAGLAGAAVARRDAALVSLLGLAGCGFAGLAGSLSTVDLVPAGAVTGSAVLLLALRAKPAVPFGVLGFAGLVTVIGQWLHLAGGLAPVRVAGLLCAVMLAVLVFAPRLAIRFARIRGPQLPRTAVELQRDIEPAPAAELAARTAAADRVLTVAAAGSAAVLAGSFSFLVAESPFPTVLAVLVAVAALLRARVFLGVWQRMPLAAAGAFGLALTTVLLAGHTWIGAVALLGLAFGVALLGVLRPPGRRLLPIWGHVANGLETVSALAVIPVLVQVFDGYARVRGLVG
jgi:ESX secretion system protein EccD